MGSESDYWFTPSESDLNEIQARRERSSKISKVMSAYLLKGYRMLATYCPECMNILMEDKQGKKYCIACEEIDKEPAAAAPKKLEPPTRVSSAMSAPIDNGHASHTIAASSLTASDESQGSATAALNEAKTVLVSKLLTAAKRLKQEENVTTCVDCATVIKAYAEALSAVLDATKKLTS